jgi:hypothetical protein
VGFSKIAAIFGTLSFWVLIENAKNPSLKGQFQRNGTSKKLISRMYSRPNSGYQKSSYPPSGGSSQKSTRIFQEEASQRKAASETQYFWDLVARYNAGHSVGIKKMSKVHEENLLFTKKSEDSAPGIIDDSIPVQRSGPKTDEISALESFHELGEIVPPSVLRCIEILKFDKPTPIQKHAIPLGLAALDLMCCAQTVGVICLICFQH